MRTGAVDFAEIVAAIRAARQIGLSEARDLCQQWRSAYAEHVKHMTSTIDRDERKAAIVAHAREVEYSRIAAHKARDAAIASLAEDIYLRVIVDPAFASWPLNRRAEYAKRAARIFHGVEE